MARRERWHHDAGSRKSLVRRYLDLLYVTVRWGEVSSLYFAQRMDMRGRSIRKDYLAYERFRYLRGARNPRPLPSSPDQYACLLQDKLLFERFFAGGGFPVARSIGTLDTGLRCDLGEWGRGDLWTMAAHGLPDMALFCKPRFGIKGRGVFRLRVEGGGVQLNDRRVTRAELEALVRRPYVCQTPVQQHEALAQLHPQSLNTVRIITFREGDRIDVFLAYLRMGGNGEITDNSPIARAIVRIDDATGELETQGYWLQGADAAPTTAHLTTRTVFGGLRIPHFPACRALATAAHQWLPGIDSVGWDVAVTPEGVVLLEGNEDWGATTAMWVMPDFTSKFLKRVQ
jgi:hypothetical protein